MEIIRKYKKLSTYNFLELIDSELNQDLSAEEITTFLDELELRKLESISEGEIYKLNLRVQKLKNKEVKK